MAFQERNGTCGMKPERFGRTLAEKSGTGRDLKWDEIFSILFRFLKWYGMFRPFRAERNGIDNLVLYTLKHNLTPFYLLPPTPFLFPLFSPLFFSSSFSLLSSADSLSNFQIPLLFFFSSIYIYQLLVNYHTNPHSFIPSL